MSGKPTILVFIDWYEPGFRAGGPVRSLVNLTSALSEQYHFKIVTSNKDYGQTESYANIETDKWIPNNHSVEVMYLKKCTYVDVKRIIKSNPADVVYIQGIFSKPFSIYPLLASKKLGVKTVVAVRGMLHTTALRVKPFKKKLKKKLFILYSKIIGMHKGVVLQASDALEKLEINTNLGKKLDVQIAPNVPIKPLEQIPTKAKKTGKLKILSVSRISSEKNNLMILDCLKEVKGEIEVDFYGADGNKEYAKQFDVKMAQLPENIIARKMGELNPMELQKVWAGYHLFFLPSLGENFGHAIYESFANGVPVLIGDNSPWRNLKNVKAGFELPVTDKQGFVNALNLFAEMDAEEYRKWSQGAKQIADTYYHNSAFETAYHGLFGC